MKVYMGTGSINASRFRKIISAIAIREKCIKVSSMQPGWNFLSNHARVLVCLARDPTARMRDIAVGVGITERAVQRIVSELVEASVISVTKDGRRNLYRINRRAPLRHPLEEGRRVDDLLRLVET
jgi:DNA-binding MarR family transcriptional regulator